MRKKAALIICTVALSLAAGSTFCSAESKLSSMSLDDLYRVRQIVTNEINERLKPGDDAIFTGIYIVGEDIKAGKYTFITERGARTNFVIIKDMETFEKAKETGDESVILFEYNFMDGTYAHISLEDGNVFYIEGAGSLTAPNGSYIPGNPEEKDESIVNEDNVVDIAYEILEESTEEEIITN